MVTFLQSGSGETVKGAVHLGVGLGVGLCFVYNVAAFCVRREAHLGINALVYGALLAFEVRQVHRHWGEPLALDPPVS